MTTLSLTTIAPARRSPSPILLQLSRWRSLIADLSFADVELTVESTAPVVATFQALRRLGHPFDPAFIVLMDKLRAQLMDGTREGCIEDYENEAALDHDEAHDDRGTGSKPDPFGGGLFGNRMCWNTAGDQLLAKLLAKSRKGEPHNLFQPNRKAVRP